MKPKIYVTDGFKDLTHLHATKAELAKRLGVYPATLTNAIKNKPVQASFVAGAIQLTNLQFEKLFQVK